jgi:hypothetical protein
LIAEIQEILVFQSPEASREMAPDLAKEVVSSLIMIGVE